MAFSTFVLLIAGGLVTSTGSGLSVPDWPLSYGQWFPPMIGGIRFEHSHRMIAGAVGILMLILTIAFLLYENRRWVRLLAVFAFLAIVLQAVLGGLTVIYLLPTVVSVFHACVGQTFFCLLAALSFFTSKEWKENAPIFCDNAGSIQRVFTMTAFLAYVQLILGALVRHAKGDGVAFHFIGAVLLFFSTLAMVLQTAQESALRSKFFWPAIFLMGLMLLQILLGLCAYVLVLVLEKKEVMTFSEVLVRTAHQANGALVLMTSFLLTLRAHRLLKC